MNSFFAKKYGVEFQILLSGETKSTNLDLIVQFKPSILSLTKETMQTG